MPLKSLNRLAEEAGDPDVGRMTFLNMSLRCGSTLLSQMVSTVPGVKAISEPYSFVYLHGLYMRKHITMGEYRQLLKTMVRIQFKKEKTNPRHTFVKFTGYMSPAFVMLKEFYPDAKYILMTRRFKPTMASHRSVIDAQSALGRLLGELHEFTHHMAAIPYDDPKWEEWLRELLPEKKRLGREHVPLALTYAGQLSDYLNHRDDYDMLILYEDLVSDPENECKNLFQLLGFDEACIPAALGAMGKDSQGGQLSKRTHRLGSSNDSDDAWVVELDALLHKYGCPVDSTTSAEELRRILKA